MNLSEIQGVAPVLQEIVEDTSVINVVRARAKELIEMGSRADDWAVETAVLQI